MFVSVKRQHDGSAARTIVGADQDSLQTSRGYCFGKSCRVGFQLFDNAGTSDDAIEWLDGSFIWQAVLQQNLFAQIAEPWIVNSTVRPGNKDDVVSFEFSPKLIKRKALRVRLRDPFFRRNPHPVDRCAGSVQDEGQGCQHQGERDSGASNECPAIDCGIAHSARDLNAYTSCLLSMQWRSPDRLMFRWSSLQTQGEIRKNTLATNGWCVLFGHVSAAQRF